METISYSENMICLNQLINCITHCYKKGEVIMTIALKIAIVVIAIVLIFPIEYVLFPKIDRHTGENSIKGVSGTIITCLVVGVVMLSAIIIFGIVEYCSPNNREIWYLYLLPMAIPIFFRFIFAFVSLQKKLLPVVLPILTIAFIGCIIFPIRDGALGYEPEVSKETKEALQEKTEIKAWLNTVSFSEPCYYDGKYIYEINKGKSDYGLLLVDDLTMDFIPCKYENQISRIIREHYPKEEIVQLGIEIRDELPYAKFGILKRPHMFSKPEVDFYVLLDMKEGKMKKEAVK